MASTKSPDRWVSVRKHGVWAGRIGVVLCLLSLVFLPGCGGCRKTPQQRAQEKKRKDAEERAKELAKKKEKKPDFQTGRLVALPHGPKPRSCYYKPGHWTSTSLPATAHNSDILGDLEMAVVTRDSKLVGMVGMPYTSSGSRQIALPKGQPKLLPSVLYIPETDREPFLSGRLRARKGTRNTFPKLYTVRKMPAYQYHFTVLARWPANYKFLETLGSVRHPDDLNSMESQRSYYLVDLLQADKRAALPMHALFWTSVAYVLWDDAEPDALLPEQQEALIDWLHWGGQLILSGPASLDPLRNTFLDPYLPATSTGTRQLVAADFEALNSTYTLPVHGKPGVPLAVTEPWAGLKFKKRPAARELPGTGGLVLERRVGRGRVVLTSFDLSNPALIKWPGFDGFVNACLLRRGPRRFVDNDLGFEVTWSDGKFGQFDARSISGLRYFTRDAGTKMTPAPVSPNRAVNSPVAFPGVTDGLEERIGPDVASWNDFNSVANEARDSLRVAAEIEIPDRRFVLWVVAGYLMVLVPLNWVVFRVLGRVEWAWVAAPVIAVVCTVVVIRLAQLDIGFARSMSEVTIAELQAGHSRAHVTRYTALYTSLSTPYEFRFSDAGAQIQPFPRVAAPDEFRLLPGEGLTKLQYRYGDEVSMRGFRVRSNDTGLVHSEQMVDLGGGVIWVETPNGGVRVTNNTAFTLSRSSVIHRDASGRFMTAWVGTLRSGDTADIELSPEPDEALPEPLFRDRRQFGSANTPVQGELGFGKLVRLAENAASLEPGDAKLVGWFDEPIPGLVVKPAAPQSRRGTLVVANLAYGFGKDPQPDRNTQREVEKEPFRVFGPGDAAGPKAAEGGGI